jgi:hypothetical protein
VAWEPWWYIGVFFMQCAIIPSLNFGKNALFWQKLLPICLLFKVQHFLVCPERYIVLLLDMQFEIIWSIY